MSTQTDQPLVSVIIPAYNHVRFVEEAVKSVWNQHYTNVELIVLDDGSSDGTGDLVDILRAKSPIPMTFVRKANEGLSRTLNRALGLAAGEYVAISASDDRVLSNRLTALVPALHDQSDTVGLAFGDGFIISESGERTGRRFSDMHRLQGGWIFEDLLLRRCVIPAPTALYRVSVLREVGGFTEGHSLEDWDMFLRITRRYPVRFVNECVAEYRAHPGQTNRTKIERLNREYTAIFQSQLDDYPKARDPKWLRKAQASLYRHIGNNYYTLRDFPSARRWLLRALWNDPTDWHCGKLLLRTLFGTKVIDLLSRTTGLLRPPARLG